MEQHHNRQHGQDTCHRRQDRTPDRSHDQSHDPGHGKGPALKCGLKRALHHNRDRARTAYQSSGTARHTEQQSSGPLVYAVEKLEQLEPELAGLLQAHWDEVEAPMYGQQTYVLDSPRYRLLETLQMLVMVTARSHSGRLAGYAAFTLVDCPHRQGRLLAALEGLYLMPAARQGWAALALLRAAEQALCRRGVAAVQYSSPQSRPCHALYRRLGAVQTETIWHQELSSSAPETAPDTAPEHTAQQATLPIAHSITGAARSPAAPREVQADGHSN